MAGGRRAGAARRRPRVALIDSAALPDQSRWSGGPLRAVIGGAALSGARPHARRGSSAALTTHQRGRAAAGGGWAALSPPAGAGGSYRALSRCGTEAFRCQSACVCFTARTGPPERGYGSAGPESRPGRGARGGAGPARGGARGGRGSRPPLRQTQAAIVTLRQRRPISALRWRPHVGAAPSDWLSAARPPGFCPPPAAPLRPGAVAAPRARAPLPRSAPAPRWLPELRRSRLDAAERPPPGGGPARTSHVRGAREVGCFSASPGALRGRRAAAAAPHVAIAVARLGAAASSDRAPARPCTPRAGTR
ncbi:translation initiation factor IF-2-like [Pyrgilauda ruficollis]|uniref:translation initiation factor IF-2-like n=1 Tax=Pyrgilauda ruficollis TaxID=221976 RepID=UPI001B87425C|nr:translation initiation factor IF-2-like [Pyrgilauda ruficollis]